MGVHIRPATRARDEYVLGVLGEVSAGRSQAEVAARFGTSREAVSVLLRRVMTDDIRYSGEPERTVRAGYGQ